MYKKIIGWVKKIKGAELMGFDGDDEVWEIKIKCYERTIYIYIDDYDFIRIESKFTLPIMYLDKDLVSKLYKVAFNRGMYVLSPDSYIDVCILRYGFSIHSSAMTKKALSSYIDGALDCCEDLKDAANYHIDVSNIIDLDLSMFLSDDIDLRTLNLDKIISVRESKFGGDWKSFIGQVKNMSNLKRKEILLNNIEKCMEFEAKNGVDLIDVYDKVMKEIEMLSEELDDESVTMN